MEYNVDSCGYCGACVAVCPHKLLELTENTVLIREGCNKCSICAEVCPLGALTPEESL